MHYHRMYRGGTLTRRPVAPKWQDIKGKRFGMLVVEQRFGHRWLCRCDCGEVATIRAGDLNKGQTTCGNRSTHWRQEDVGYWGVHQRLETDRGPAASHPCKDCGETAAHWSYSNAGADERRDEKSGLAYSLDPNDYTPRCVTCHGRFDARAKRAA